MISVVNYESVRLFDSSAFSIFVLLILSALCENGQKRSLKFGGEERGRKIQRSRGVCCHCVFTSHRIFYFLNLNASSNSFQCCPFFYLSDSCTFHSIIKKRKLSHQKALFQNGENASSPWFHRLKKKKFETQRAVSLSL